eukprot:417341-Amphidinium_carterae.1
MDQPEAAGTAPDLPLPPPGFCCLPFWSPLPFALPPLVCQSPLESIGSSAAGTQAAASHDKFSDAVTQTLQCHHRDRFRDLLLQTVGILLAFVRANLLLPLSLFHGGAKRHHIGSFAGEDAA